MIIRCEECETSYHLDQSLLEPFGSKVRCTRCGHIFWAELPSFSETEIQPESTFKPDPLPILDQEEQAAAFQLHPPKKRFRLVLLIIGLIILGVLAARFFYVQNQHPDWNISDLFSGVFFLPVDPEGNQKISLLSIKKFFKDNQKIGRFFIIEGEIKNGYPDTRQMIKIRGSLRTAENKVAVSREVYAGWTLTPEELETLSFEEITRLASTQPERFNPNVLVPPGKTIPFMILFPPLPPGSTQVSIEVISSQSSQPATIQK
ncbi:MAG: DUF3426 domain-containing protein [Pseudomonadota bacterium]